MTEKSIGVIPDDRGLLDVDDSYQTAQEGVYACGDVIGYPALASTSMEQGVRAAHHMWSDKVPYPPPPFLFHKKNERYQPWQLLL